MTAPLVTARDGHVLLIPQDVSLDELAERMEVRQRAVEDRDDLQYNHPGADLTEADNRVLAAEDDVLALLHIVMDPAEANALGSQVLAKAWQARNPEAVA